MLLKTLVFLGLACVAMAGPVMVTHHEETDSGLSSTHGKHPGRIYLTPRLYILESDISKYLEETEDLETTFHSSSHTTKEASRVRRSPQTAARVEYNIPGWTSDNGRHSLQGGGYYQRNWDVRGPKQDYGGNLQYSYRFPG